MKEIKSIFYLGLYFLAHLIGMVVYGVLYPFLWVRFSLTKKDFDKYNHYRNRPINVLLFLSLFVEKLFDDKF
jgi:hypothetical protein